jgi:hypothetical protein
MTIFEKIHKIGIRQFVFFILITTIMFFWSYFFSDKEFSWSTIYKHREDIKMYIALLYAFISALFIHVGILSCFKFPPPK